MATIESLPFELLVLILDLAVPCSLEVDSHETLAHRYSFLLSTSLLSSQFRTPSQAVLFESVRITKSATATKWLSSPLVGVYATRRLDMTGLVSGEGLSGTVATRVISKSVGIQWLRLRDFKSLGLKVFQIPSLQGLRALILGTSFPGSDSTPAPLLPFQLRALHLANRPLPALFLLALLTASSSTLTHLKLALSPTSVSYPPFLHAFRHVAPTLQSLSLPHRPSPAFIHQLTECTNLSRLVCHPSVDLEATLDSLANSKLSTLEIEVNYNTANVVGTLRNRLARGALVKLSRLRVRGVNRRELGLVGVEEFVDECHRMGVDLELDPESVVKRVTRLPG